MVNHLITIKKNQLYVHHWGPILLGLMGAFAFPPFNLFFLGIAAYAGLFYFVYISRSLKTAILVTFLWSIAFFVSGLWWIAEALLVDGNAFRWAYPFAVLGLPILLSLFHVGAVAIFKKIQNVTTFNVSVYAILLSLVFSLFEYFRGVLFTGFPWNLPAYIWTEQLALLQSLKYLGAYGLSSLTILLSFACASMVVERSRYVVGLLAISLFVFISLHFIGQASLKVNSAAKYDNVYVRVVQPNIAQADKWNPDLYESHLRKIEKLALKPIQETTAQNVLVVLPETAVNDVMMSLPKAKEVFNNIVQEYKSRGKTLYILTGALRSHISSTGKRAYFNSALLYDESGYIINDYNKSHLVPFGEYMPFSDIIDIAPIVGFSGFSSGLGPKTIHHDGIPSFAIAICYEIIFPNKFIDQSDRPDFVFTLTNDAWYGDTPGPYQHYMMSRYRAIEEGVVVIRAANTGVSGGFDSKGRILGKPQGLMSRGVVDIDFSK